MTSLLARAKGRATNEYHTFVRFLQAKRGGLYVDRGGDYRNSVLISGSGRGGTTWLAEIINCRNDFRDIFEPFHPGHVAMCRNFARRQYLRPTDDDPRYLDPANRILSGKLRSEWSDRYNRRFWVRKRLIKEIRTNLLLRWLRHHFPEMPIVVLLRHPCAVAHSRVYQGWNAVLDIEDLLSQTSLVEDHLRPFVRAITSAQSAFERHLLVWCIENYVPLRVLQQGDALVVFYEDLCVNPEFEIERMANYIHLEAPELMIRRIRKPSSQTRQRASAIVLGESLVASWKKHVNEEMLDQAMRALDLFGLSSIYGRSEMPLRSAASVLQRPKLPEDTATLH